MPRLKIEQFIHNFKMMYLTVTFESPEDIKNFTWTNESTEKRLRPIERFYTQGMCYWFAKILKEVYPEGEIWYNYDKGHVVFKYNNDFYDITGVVKLTGRYINFEKILGCTTEVVDKFRQCYISSDDNDINKENDRIEKIAYTHALKLAYDTNDMIIISNKGLTVESLQNIPIDKRLIFKDTEMLAELFKD